MAKEVPTSDVNEEVPGDADGEGIEQDQYLVFIARDQEFGIKAMRVREISAMVDITMVPKAPPYIDGILNLRGRLVSVINFRKKFGFESKKQDEDTRIIIVEHDGFPIGIMVDGVEEVVRIPDENVQKLPEVTVTAASGEYLTGAGMLHDRLIVLLDVDRLLSRSEVAEVEAARKAGRETLAIAVAGPGPVAHVDTTGHALRKEES